MEGVDTVEEIVSIIADLTRQYGFDYFGILRQPKPHENPMRLILTGSFPEGWPETYIKKRYVLIDPVIRYLNHVRHGFRWTESAVVHVNDSHGRRMERMMADAKKFGLEDGYCFPVHGRRGLLGHLTVGGRPVDLTRADIALFDSFARCAFWRLLELVEPDVGSALAQNVEIKMTHREMEALSYLSEGLTSPEIATELELSNHTVDWYMNGIQQKLQAKNRHHAIAIAFRLGLIS
nr:LuxR family transcriptional regulator [Pararhizobium haloflavum]